MWGVGTWDVGAFDNDTAADWCGDLQDAVPGERMQIVRGALSAVAGPGDEYLDQDVACEAIAAAAIVASQLPGGTPVGTPYAPDFLRAGGTLPVGAEIVTLALRALDRIVGEDSEWRELWQESPESYAQALAVLDAIRADLERSI